MHWEAFTMVNEKKIKCMDMAYYIIKAENLLMRVNGNMINLMDKALFLMKNLKNFLIINYLIIRISQKFIIIGLNMKELFIMIINMDWEHLRFQMEKNLWFFQIKL